MPTREPSAWTRAWAALRRSLLGKSQREYLNSLAGDQEYWERAIAAQLGWPQGGRSNDEARMTKEGRMPKSE